MASDATVKVPGVGPEKKSTVLLFGGAGVVVIIYAMAQKKKNAAAAAAAAAAAGSSVSAAFTDPAGNTCAAPDASTGYCPGTPEDIAAQEQLSGSGTFGIGSGFGSSLTSLGGQSLNNAVPVFTNNGAWGQYVEQMLGSNGSDSIAAAIAKYLAGTSLTTDQATVVEEAIAIANYPPVSGPGGFPPSMNTQTTTAQPGTCPSGYTWAQTATGAAGEMSATGGAGWCQAPVVTTTPVGSCPAGYTYSAGKTGAAGEIAATGGTGWCEHAPVTTTPPGHTTPPGSTMPASVASVTAAAAGPTSIAAHWAASAGATSYQVRVTYQSQVVQTHMTSQTSYTVTGLTPDHTYGIHVVAINGSSWAPETSTTAATPKS